MPAGQKVAVAHFFCAAMDWYLVELDRDGQLGFGYVLNRSDPHGSEWGYFSITELADLLVLTKGGPVYVERDLHWTVRPVPQGRA